MTTKFTTSEGLFKHLDAGFLAELSGEVFDYFLGIIQPIDFSGVGFLFQEGHGDTYMFVSYADSYWARLFRGEILTKDYMLCMKFKWIRGSIINDENECCYSVEVFIDDLSFLNQYIFSSVADLKRIAELYSDGKLNHETFLADANIVSYIHLPKAQ